MRWGESQVVDEAVRYLRGKVSKAGTSRRVLIYYERCTDILDNRSDLIKAFLSPVAFLSRIKEMRSYWLVTMSIR